MSKVEMSFSASANSTQSFIPGEAGTCPRSTRLPEPKLPARQRRQLNTRARRVTVPEQLQLNPSPGPRQRNSTPTPTQLNSTQHNSKRERSERAPPAASHCEQHLLTKMRLAVSFYYLEYEMGAR